MSKELKKELDTELIEMIKDYYKRKEARDRQLAYEELKCFTEVLKGWNGEENE